MQELIAGRLTLAAAAERFRTISEEATSSYPLGAFRNTFGGLCDQERWCKCVLQCARMELRGRADSAAVVAALEEQLEELSGDWSGPG